MDEIDIIDLDDNFQIIESEERNIEEQLDANKKYWDEKLNNN
jgi:hypothetical protein